jgi:hypothetical protein
MGDHETRIGKAFFFEKKKQKTFIPRLPPDMGYGHTIGSCGEIKVFCFFSSEKKFLSFLGHEFCALSKSPMSIFP